MCTQESMSFNYFQTQTYLESLQKEIYKRLPDKARELDDLFSEKSPYMDPFSSVKTAHLQLSYYRTHFNLIVSFALLTSILILSNGLHGLNHLV